jgi:hypothetical protein
LPGEDKNLVWAGAIAAFRVSSPGLSILEMSSPFLTPAPAERSRRFLVRKFRLVIPCLVVWAVMLWPVSAGIHKLLGWDPVTSFISGIFASYFLLLIGFCILTLVVAYTATAIHELWRARRRALKRRAARERKRLRLLRESSPTSPPA